MSHAPTINCWIFCASCNLILAMRRWGNPAIFGILGMGSWSTDTFDDDDDDGDDDDGDDGDDDDDDDDDDLQQ